MPSTVTHGPFINASDDLRDFCNIILGSSDAEEAWDKVVTVVPSQCSGKFYFNDVLINLSSS